MNALMILLAIVATLAIFATTKPGRAVLKNVGLRDLVPGAASTEDYEYLLSACGGDHSEMERRIAIEESRFPDLTEAEHFRRAIRKVFDERNR